MIEKVTLQLSGDADFTSEGGPRCEEMNPKTLLLYAAAKCVGKTALMIMDKERFRPKRFEIGISGELSDETPQSESTFKSFHVVYNIECDTEDDQAKVSRAVTLAHEKYCGMMQMLRKGHQKDLNHPRSPLLSCGARGSSRGCPPARFRC